MGHSIAAKYAARPTARFVRPSSRTRERRLGLNAPAAYIAASARPTVLRGPAASALASLHASWRSFATPTTPARNGRIRPVVRMAWSRSGGGRSGRRSGAASAPWHD